MGVCTFANANTIPVWLDGETIQAKLLSDGTMCDTATNTIILQDETKNGQPCPKPNDDTITYDANSNTDSTPVSSGTISISSENGRRTFIVTKSFNRPNITIMSDEELDQAINSLVASSKEPELPTYSAPVYQGWIYDYIEDEFSDYGANIATIISTDKNAGLTVGMDNKKKLYVSFLLSQNVDDDFVAHYPLCYGECTIDLRVDDNKYPNIAIVRQGNMLYSKYPQTTLKRIKNGSVIKIRVPLLSGSLHTYTFVIDEPLNMRKLKLIYK